jgi:hypothetical protein
LNGMEKIDAVRRFAADEDGSIEEFFLMARQRRGRFRHGHILS